MKDDRPAHPVDDMSDNELDRYILTRLRLVGVDLSVLPVDDPSAPADRVRILRSARSFLRETLPDLTRLRIGPEEAPPELYPAAFFPVLSAPPRDRASE